RVQPLPVLAIECLERVHVPRADAINPYEFRSGSLRLVGEAGLEGHRRRPHGFRGLKRVRNPEKSQDPGRPVIRTPDMSRRGPAGLRRAREELANRARSVAHRSASTSRCGCSVDGPSGRKPIAAVAWPLDTRPYRSTVARVVRCSTHLAARQPGPAMSRARPAYVVRDRATRHRARQQSVDVFATTSPESI